jgi:uncharacterized membrane protein YoaK (UPF0700 family)
MLLIVLSLIAGCTDVIGFLGLSGLFTAHITGNLVVLAAHIAAGEPAKLGPLLSVPVFIVVIGLTMLLVSGLEMIGLAPLRSLLLLQFLLLGSFLGVCVAAGSDIDAEPVLAGMFGVAAMAVQNALVRVALPGAPATAVMTSNVTRFAIDAGRLLLPGDPQEISAARGRISLTLPPILGFTAGCGIGAACESAFGIRSLAVPVGLALLAFIIGFAPGAGGRR